MQKLIYCIGLVIACYGFQLVNLDHSIYIAQVNIKNQSTFATIKIKIFADDFRDALQNHFPKQQFIPNETLCEQQEQITTYITTHFYCTINQKKRTLVFQSCLLENGMYHLSFKCTTPKNWLNATIKADFLMELFPTQSNIISFQYNQEKRFSRLQKGNAIVTWQFE